MEDMAGKISELLSNPEGMEKIKSVAASLFSGGSSENSENSRGKSDVSENTDSSETNESGGFSLPDGIDPMKIMSMISLLNNPKSDKRTGLLLALKPHLTEERQQRVDKAVKLLKIISVIPSLKEQGLLDIF